MDELKNENVAEQPVAEEAVVEQRPSTKYGRTAYQQQLQEEQAAQNQTEQGTPQQNGYQYWEGPQNPYQQNTQPQNTYQQNQYQQYAPYQEPQADVKKWPAYVLMVLVAVMGVLSFVGTIMGLDAYGQAESIEEMYELLGALTVTPAYEVLTMITDLVFWTTMAFLIWDISQVHKAGKKIGGAIAFAIFLRPAYFIWRAHLLGEKKTLPIIFTVCVYLLSFVDYGIAFAEAFEMIMRIM